MRLIDTPPGYPEGLQVYKNVDGNLQIPVPAKERIPWVPVLGRFACNFSRKGRAGPFFGVRAGGGTSAYNPPSVLSP
jgi:hypothetical protein